MSTEVQYRLLRDSEVEAASELAQRVFDEFVASQHSVDGQEEFRRHASPTAMRERHRAGWVTFAAVRDGRLIGMLHLGDGKHIHLLFVERSSQRRGVGRSLIGAAKEYALTRQPPARVLTVGATPNAVEDYRRMGFVPVGNEQVLTGIRFIPMELEIGRDKSAPAMLPRIEPPDSFHLRAAQGWLELGNHLEANEELERIAPQLRAHPDVLEIRWHVYARAKKWEACVDIAQALIKLTPNRAEAWIHRSFALHELKHTQEAFDQLLPVADRLPQVWTIPYNLACYCAQLGRLEECRRWFEKAMAIDQHTVKRAAIDDPD
jgi:GNAT superfamily N-acetyltransferase